MRFSSSSALNFPLCDNVDVKVLMTDLEVRSHLHSSDLDKFRGRIFFSCAPKRGNDIIPSSSSLTIFAEHPVHTARVSRYDTRVRRRDRQGPLAGSDSKDVDGGTDRNEPDGIFYSRLVEKDREREGEREREGAGAGGREREI